VLLWILFFFLFVFVVFENQLSYSPAPTVADDYKKLLRVLSFEPTAAAARTPKTPEKLAEAAAKKKEGNKKNEVCMGGGGIQEMT
jgi:hypothetical protein